MGPQVRLGLNLVVVQFSYNQCSLESEKFEKNAKFLSKFTDFEPEVNNIKCKTEKLKQKT